MVCRGNSKGLTVNSHWKWDRQLAGYAKTMVIARWNCVRCVSTMGVPRVCPRLLFCDQCRCFCVCFVAGFRVVSIVTKMWPVAMAGAVWCI